MRIYDVIEKKAAHHELTKEELQFFVEGLCSGKVPDYQAAALIMAMFLNGMSDQETADLTAVMADSGEHIEKCPAAAWVVQEAPLISWSRFQAFKLH